MCPPQVAKITLVDLTHVCIVIGAPRPVFNAGLLEKIEVVESNITVDKDELQVEIDRLAAKGPLMADIANVYREALKLLLNSVCDGELPQWGTAPTKEYPPDESPHYRSVEFGGSE